VQVTAVAAPVAAVVSTTALTITPTSLSNSNAGQTYISFTISLGGEAGLVAAAIGTTSENSPSI